MAFEACFSLKSLSEEGHFSGYASVFHVVDCQGDQIQPGAFSKGLAATESGGPWPKMLWQHDPCVPIGRWEQVREDQAGLFVEGRLFLALHKAQEAHVLLREGVVDGLSIGYHLKKSHRAGGVRILEEVALSEISLVTFPANPKARVAQVKSPALSLRPFEALYQVIEGL